MFLQDFVHFIIVLKLNPTSLKMLGPVLARQLKFCGEILLYQRVYPREMQEHQVHVGHISFLNFLLQHAFYKVEWLASTWTIVAQHDLANRIEFNYRAGAWLTTPYIGVWNATEFYTRPLLQHAIS